MGERLERPEALGREPQRAASSPGPSARVDPRPRRPSSRRAGSRRRRRRPDGSAAPARRAGTVDGLDPVGGQPRRPASFPDDELAGRGVEPLDGPRTVDRSVRRTCAPVAWTAASSRRPSGRPGVVRAGGRRGGSSGGSPRQTAPARPPSLRSARGAPASLKTRSCPAPGRGRAGTGPGRRRADRGDRGQVGFLVGLAEGDDLAVPDLEAERLPRDRSRHRRRRAPATKLGGRFHESSSSMAARLGRSTSAWIVTPSRVARSGPPSSTQPGPVGVGSALGAGFGAARLFDREVDRGVLGRIRPRDGALRRRELAPPGQRVRPVVEDVGTVAPAEDPLDRARSTLDPPELARRRVRRFARRARGPSRRGRRRPSVRSRTPRRPAAASRRSGSGSTGPRRAGSRTGRRTGPPARRSRAGRPVSASSPGTTPPFWPA